MDEQNNENCPVLYIQAETQIQSRMDLVHNLDSSSLAVSLQFLSGVYAFSICFLCVCASGCREFFKKKKHKTFFCPQAIHWKFWLSPARLDSGEMEFKTKLKVYHRLAALASDKNDQSERQICLDSHRGMKIARRIRLPWQFQRSGHHAGRAADAHVRPFIRSSEACHQADFKGRVWVRATALIPHETNNLASSYGGAIR